MAKKSAPPPADDTDDDAAEIAAESVSSAGEVADELASAGADDAGDESTGEAAPASSPPTPSWRDLAKAEGLDDLPDDDAAAIKGLAALRREAAAAKEAAQQAAQYAQYGQQVMPYASEFQQFIEQKQAALRGPEQADPWAEPDFDPVWLTQVTTGEDGEYVPIPAKGGTLETVNKLNRVVDYQRRFLQKPLTAITSHVDRRVEAKAREMIQAEMANMRQEYAASQFITNNREWLYAKDDEGKPVFQDGQPLLSEEGAFFSNQLAEANRIGLSAQQQEAVALNALRMRRQFSGGSTGTGTAPAKAKTADETKTDFLKKAAGHGTGGGAATKRTVTASDADGTETSSLADMLRSAFAEAGVDDKTFQSV